MTDRKTDATHIFLLIGVAVLCVQTAFGETLSADLLALWLAGQSLADGTPHLVYATETVFTIRPPAAWVPMAVATGHDNQIFPFIYPPLAAAVMSWIVGLTSFATFAALVHLANIALGLATSWLAWRASGRAVALPVFLFIGALIFHMTVIGTIALDQGQPQVLVAFLTVLAIERLQARDETGAGTALALAAALKVYPVLFVVFLIARRNWTAVGVFAAVGTALGLLSVALTGWPLHAAFLGQLSAISHTAIRLPLTFSFDSLIALLHTPDSIVKQMTVPSFDKVVGLIGIVEKGPLWSLLNKVALLAALAGLGWCFARRFHILLWPIAMILLAMLSPLAWSHHFLAAVAFAPMLIRRWNLAVLLAIFLPLSIPVLSIPDAGTWMVRALTPIGALSMIGLVAAMALRPADLRRLVRRNRPGANRAEVLAG